SGTPAARAFNSYTLSERRQIQARLQQWGYYNGGIDGTFGPQTYRAISAYAADARATEDLNTVGGSYDLYEQLIG
ncbi:MAG: peptidoglycan-binding protein, partial [Rhodobacteraceae bacterium]|nr:peptidoglycan-binding protein [Paracoccaceae bacterium]